MPPKRTPSGSSTAAMFRIAVALFDIGPRRQWTTAASATESNVESTGSGSITLAWIVVGCIASRRRAHRPSTFGLGSSSAISVPAGGAAFSRK